MGTPKTDLQEIGATAAAAADDATTDAAADAVLAEINAKHAVINWQGRIRILTDSINPTTQRPEIALSTVADMTTWFANTPKLGRAPRFQWWLKQPQRRQYTGVVFEPQREVEGYYNLWRGWGVVPREGDCGLYLTLVREVICSGNDKLYRWVLAWCADAVQNPARRPGVALVLRGPQGVGKGAFARTLGELFGDHFLHIRHTRHLTGNFNAHLANVLLLFADEAYFPGDRSGEGALKGVITEPTTPLELKGKDVISVNNYVRVVMASNSDWIVPAGWDDRRFAVLDVTRDHMQDNTYFGAIDAQMEAGGYEALLHYLLHYPLGDVDLRKIPDTRARHEQQIHSLDSFQAFWLHWLEEPPLDFEPDRFVVTKKLYNDYKESAGRYAISEVSFGMRLVKLFPAATRERKKTPAPGEYADAQRLWGYTFPPISEMRTNYDQTFNQKTDWPPT